MSKRRRANGEGSVSRRADGRWVATISIGRDKNGRIQRRAVYGRTQREAVAHLRKLQADLASGAPVTPDKTRLGEFLDRWLEDAARPCVAFNTLRIYRGFVKNHIAPAIGGITVRQLSPANVLFLHSEMERRGASPRLRQMVHTTLRRALRDAVQWGVLARNPCDLVERPRASRSEAAYLNSDQVQALLSAAKGDRLEALIVLAVSTGLRQGELLGLQWGDIDLEARTLSVRRQLKEEKQGRPVLGELKTAKSRRLVVLPKIAVAALRVHKAQHNIAHHPTALVFTGRRGFPLRKTNLLRRWYHPLVAKAGLPHFRFHGLRHTHATLLLSAGIHPKVVQERLGHASVMMTLDTYSHVTPSLQAEAAVRLDAALGQ
jgi:integrase